LVIVTTSVRLSLSGDCTVLICESVLLCIFKPELSVTQLFALSHFVSQSGQAWHVSCDNPTSWPSLPAQLQAQERPMPSASSDGHTPLQFPNAKSKISPGHRGLRTSYAPSVRSRQKLDLTAWGAGKPTMPANIAGLAFGCEIHAASLDRLMSSTAEELRSRWRNSVKPLIVENLKSHASSLVQIRSTSVRRLH
jgi:hypothetical protein